jgi:hypothetical protein
MVECAMEEEWKAWLTAKKSDSHHENGMQSRRQRKLGANRFTAVPGLCIRSPGTPLRGWRSSRNTQRVGWTRTMIEIMRKEAKITVPRAQDVSKGQRLVAASVWNGLVWSSSEAAWEGNGREFVGSKPVKQR